MLTVTVVMSPGLWEDTLAWLWLGRRQQIDNPPGLSPLTVVAPLIPVDEMWHSFILCTREYAELCQNLFGTYIHHEPEINPGDRFSKDEYSAQMSYVISGLGSRRAFRLYLSNAISFGRIIAAVESRSV